MEDWVSKDSLDSGWPVLNGAPSLDALANSWRLALLRVIHTFSAASLTSSCLQPNFMARALVMRLDMWEIDRGIASFLGVQGGTHSLRIVIYNVFL